jgi:DNA-binding NtrC family response regulator
MNKKKNILYIDDDPQQFGPFSDDIQSFNENKPVCAQTLNDKSVKLIIQEGIDIAFIDYDLLGGINGIEIAKQLKEAHENHCHTFPIHFILLTGKGSEDVAKKVIRSGLFQDYINKGFEAKDEIQRALFYFENIRRKEKELLNVTNERNNYKSLVEHVTPNIRFEDGEEIIGKSETIKQYKQFANLYSQCDENVLITGPSGSGKELIARAIHYNHKTRSNKPFIPVNCAALPGNLIESELFGYVKGAFTGATIQKEGKFKAADTGTLFLDEIGDLSLGAQAKILRVLQDGNVTRLGSNELIKVDVRLICATNKDLKVLVQEHEFREDLYYRISSFFPRVLSLSEHKEDIPLLVEHFANQCKSELKKNSMWIKGETQIFQNEVISLLMDKEWQGNIRELQKFIRQVIFLFQNEIPFNEARVEEFYKHWKELNPSFVFSGYNHSDEISNNISTPSEGSKPEAALFCVLHDLFDKWEISYKKLKNQRMVEAQKKYPDKNIIPCKTTRTLDALTGNNDGYLLPKLEDINSNAPNRFVKTNDAGEKNREAAKQLFSDPKNKDKWPELREIKHRFFDVK